MIGFANIYKKLQKYIKHNIWYQWYHINWLSADVQEMVSSLVFDVCRWSVSRLWRCSVLFRSQIGRRGFIGFQDGANTGRSGFSQFHDMTGLMKNMEKYGKKYVTRKNGISWGLGRLRFQLLNLAKLQPNNWDLFPQHGDLFVGDGLTANQRSCFSSGEAKLSIFVIETYPWSTAGQGSICPMQWLQVAFP